MKIKKIILTILQMLYFIIVSFLIATALYLKTIFKDIVFDELIFYLNNGVSNTDNNVFYTALKFIIPRFTILLFILITLFIVIKNIKKKINKKKSKKIEKRVFIKLINNSMLIINIFLLIFTLLFAISSIKFDEYIKNDNLISDFIEREYVDPRNVNIEFDNNRNLIIILAESLETSFFTKDQGGYWEYEVIPELYKLLKDKESITFYDNNRTQGMKMLSNSSWTTASTVTNTSALPFKIPMDGNEYHSDNFMPGIYNLGDYLKEQGYYLEQINASNSDFGGIEEYFTKHGNYNIIDSRTSDEYLSMKKSDYSGWGFNDNYLFELAKVRLKEIEKKNKPFNLVLQTIDTHHFDGYVGDYTLDKFDTQYENVYATESKLIADFVDWIKDQDFYENTTILIVGDHINMQTEYFEKRDITDRYIYNCIINPVIKTANNKKRVFTALDTFPTILAAMGANIENDRLGLGVNLFSDLETLAEQYGFEELNNELNKKSDFYNKTFLKGDYEEMLEELEKKNATSDDKTENKIYDDDENNDEDENDDNDEEIINNTNIDDNEDNDE